MGWAIDRSLRLSQSTVKVMGQQSAWSKEHGAGSLSQASCQCAFVN
jgi:hypothetical protein